MQAPWETVRPTGAPPAFPAKIKYTKMQINFLKALLTSLTAAIAITSCSDDKFSLGPDPGEGQATLSAEILFRNYTPALSRTPGTALNGIDNLFIFVYDTSGNLIFNKSFNKGDEGFTITPNTEKPSDGTDVDIPVSTDKANFSFQLPYGKYRIYAAANIRGDYAATFTDPENFDSEEKLCAIKFNWNSGNIADNDQMFGCFTTSAPAQSPATPSIRETEDGRRIFVAETVTINKPNITLSAWLRRLASKVTVAYDGSGLNQGVWLYIKNVTVHDIAASCYLGEENAPDNPDELLNARSGQDNHPGSSYTPSVANTRLTYNVPGADHIYDKTQTGLEVYNGLVNAEGESVTVGSDHSAAADALFFYENMQGDYSTKPDKEKYDKRQQGSGPDQVGENIRDDIDGNDYKDRVKYGTYVEVEAYYISTNPLNPSQGNIKYRFMLGKDVRYNYDVERNYHYKLTLGFRGWANQPDWHIDYDQPDPALEVPPVFRVSYLYHQKSSLPVKISGNCTALTVEILENNWAPCDPNTLDVPANSVITSQPERYEFKWNKAAYDDTYKKITTVDGRTINIGYPYLGFLALNVPNVDNKDKLPITIPARGNNYYSFGDRQDAWTAMKTYYESSYGKGTQAKSTYGPQDLTIGEHKPAALGVNSWEVTELDDGTDKKKKIVMVPLWTRAKTIIEGSGFSGNNPYEYFNRKATLKVTATYQLSPGNTKTLTEYVTVLQEPRIVNPKAVWRKSGSNQAFHVQLMTAKGSNAQSDYEPLKSDGEWTAYVEVGSGVVSLSKSAGTIGDETADGKIVGKTGSSIDFDINFKSDGCGIVSVLYHSNNCVHKIFVRQGYETPISLGGKQWSSYTLRSATYINGTDGSTDRYTAVQTSSPLELGSLFRRGRQRQGILESNNTALPPFKAPNGAQFSTPAGNLTWVGIGYRDDRFTDANQNKTLGTFVIGNTNYMVPTLQDFENLKSSCNFGYGILYGDGASGTSDKFSIAAGYNGTNTQMGVRGVMAYNPINGNQVFFPMGKDGYGRRRQFNFSSSNDYGMLIYADVNDVLTGSKTTDKVWSSSQNKYLDNNNVFRPVPYNLPIVPGAVYWIDKYVADGHYEAGGTYPCLGWDCNYFNYDFNSYTANNYRDACPIKLIRK